MAGRRKENVVFSVCLRSVGAQWSEGLSIEKRGVSAVAASKPVPHPGAVGAHITIQPRTNLSIHHRKQAYPTPRTQHRPPRRGALYMNPSLISAPTPCMSRPHYMGRLVSTDLNLWTGRYKHTWPGTQIWTCSHLQGGWMAEVSGCLYKVCDGCPCGAIRRRRRIARQRMQRNELTWRCADRPPRPERPQRPASRSTGTRTAHV